MPVVIAVLVGGLVGCGSEPASDAESGQGGRASSGSAELDGTSMPPWPAPGDVPARVAAAGLDLGAMGMVEHYHPQLRIIVNGASVMVPADIGVDPASGAMSGVHTHESGGTIHIEAGTAGEKFTLRQVFTQWGVALTRTQIGGVKGKPGQQVTLTSNGVPVSGDPMDLRLEPNQKIVLRLP